MAKKLTPQEKKAREEYLKNETIEQRTKRVLEPRVKKTLKQIQFITKSVNSPRYKLSDEQAQQLLTALYSQIETLENAINRKTNKVEFEFS